MVLAYCKHNPHKSLCKYRIKCSSLVCNGEMYRKRMWKILRRCFINRKAFPKDLRQLAMVGNF